MTRLLFVSFSIFLFTACGMWDFHSINQRTMTVSIAESRTSYKPYATFLDPQLFSSTHFTSAPWNVSQVSTLLFGMNGAPPTPIGFERTPGSVAFTQTLGFGSFPVRVMTFHTGDGMANLDVYPPDPAGMKPITGVWATETSLVVSPSTTSAEIVLQDQAAVGYARDIPITLCQPYDPAAAGVTGAHIRVGGKTQNCETVFSSFTARQGKKRGKVFARPFQKRVRTSPTQGRTLSGPDDAFMRISGYGVNYPWSVAIHEGSGPNYYEYTEFNNFYLPPPGTQVNLTVSYFVDWGDSSGPMTATCQVSGTVPSEFLTMNGANQTLYLYSADTSEGCMMEGGSGSDDMSVFQTLLDNVYVNDIYLDTSTVTSQEYGRVAIATNNGFYVTNTDGFYVGSSSHFKSGADVTSVFLAANNVYISILNEIGELSTNLGSGSTFGGFTDGSTDIHAQRVAGSSSYGNPLVFAIPDTGPFPYKAPLDSPDTLAQSIDLLSTYQMSGAKRIVFDQGRLWIAGLGTNSLLSCTSGSNWESATCSPEATTPFDNQPTALAATGSGSDLHVAVGTDFDGLYYLSGTSGSLAPQQITTTSHPSLPSNIIKAVHINDNHDLLFVGTSHGLHVARLTDNPIEFTTYSRPDFDEMGDATTCGDYPTNTVTSIHGNQGPDPRVYVGTECGIFVRYFYEP